MNKNENWESGGFVHYPLIYSTVTPYLDLKIIKNYNVTGIETPDHIVRATMNQLKEGDSLYG